MTELLSEVEEVPANYPVAPSGLSAVITVEGNPMELSTDTAWARIESWVRVRWTPRDVAWVVEGPGDWVPPLSPAVVNGVECWASAGWESVALDASPLGGLQLPGDGPYRVSATVGEQSPETVPEPAQQAFRRLWDYWGSTPGRHLHTTISRSIGDGALARQYELPEVILARAMQRSGAADLLRPYRRIK